MNNNVQPTQTNSMTQISEKCCYLFQQLQMCIRDRSNTYFICVCVCVCVCVSVRVLGGRGRREP